MARRMDDGLTLEVTRVCTDGTRNANSILYGACARTAKGMGYNRIITYTLQSESGASLRAAGWNISEENAGGVHGIAIPDRAKSCRKHYSGLSKNTLLERKYDGRRYLSESPTAA